jgi:hypothetical protein
MRHVLQIPALCLALAGCAALAPPAPKPPQPSQVSAPEPVRRLPGTTIASLGAATEPGLWMRTPLVSGPRRGRVVDPASGRSVVLDLIPLDADPGAGSRLSLAAYQSLNLPLTALPELRVEPAG